LFRFAILLLLALPPSAGAQLRADRIYVDKSEHRLDVYSGNKVIASFKAGFGVYPVGPKQRQGDRKTPEGKYVLDYKNPNSAYYRSIHISYPNAADRASARERRVDPGGLIMIHGEPNDREIARRIRDYGYRDWTDGCIALSDEDMKSLWDMVKVPVPIEIVP